MVGVACVRRVMLPTSDSDRFGIVKGEEFRGSRGLSSSY